MFDIHSRLLGIWLRLLSALLVIEGFAAFVEGPSNRLSLVDERLHWAGPVAYSICCFLSKRR